MELCDSVQLDPEKNNSWEGVHEEDTYSLAFFLFLYFFLLVLIIKMLNLVMMRLSSMIQRRTTFGLVSTRKTQKNLVHQFGQISHSVITTTMAIGNVIQMIVVKL